MIMATQVTCAAQPSVSEPGTSLPRRPRRQQAQRTACRMLQQRVRTAASRTLMQSKMTSAEPGMWSLTYGPCSPWGWARSSSKACPAASEAPSLLARGVTSGRLVMGALHTSQTRSPCQGKGPAQPGRPAWRDAHSSTGAQGARLDAGPLLGTHAVPEGQLAPALALQLHGLPALQTQRARQACRPSGHGGTARSRAHLKVLGREVLQADEAYWALLPRAPRAQQVAAAGA